MRHIGLAFLFVLTVSISATADPVTKFEGFLSNSANPHFGSKLLMEAGLAHDAGLHLGWSKHGNNLITSGPSIDLMSAPDVCQTTPAVSAPEPATMLLLGTGLVGIGAIVRKARKQT